MHEGEDELEVELELEYSSHREQVMEHQPSPERVEELNGALLKAFERVIEYRSAPFILFDLLTVEELTDAFYHFPIIIKPVLTCVNVAQRAIKRDLDLDFDTYSRAVSERVAAQLAGYVRPFLPRVLGVSALMELDRFFWTDKEMRAKKGNWERVITQELNERSTEQFRKRKFNSDGQAFELDAALPTSGPDIRIGIDVKRIESRRDIHKRSDEIVNKASKFKKAFPNSKFVAVMYFPFPSLHTNLNSRLTDSNIDLIYFAGESKSSIVLTVEMLLAQLGILKETEDAS
ncbi:hypothetical protein AB9E19_14660 [Rhizobium leguminosarum]|uniref:hypothetical protein n=1 Tax=Rhizobium leguminosarum TaxID=384 RepID=UPI003F9D04A8